MQNQNNKVLSALLEEKKLASEEVAKIDSLIKLYTGKSEKKEATSGIKYPVNGRWKDKILFTLKVKNKPLTCEEIINYVSKHEKDIPQERIEHTIPQYCSSMKQAGELSAEKVDKRKNKYFPIAETA